MPPCLTNLDRTGSMAVYPSQPYIWDPDPTSISFQKLNLPSLEQRLQGYISNSYGSARQATPLLGNHDKLHSYDSGVRIPYIGYEEAQTRVHRN
jgi:hypothetical protein